MLTREMLDDAMAAGLRQGAEPLVYFVPPSMLRTSRIALAYMYGKLTRAEYRALVTFELRLMRFERG